MNIICNQEELNKGLNQVSRIATKNVSLPILNNVLIRAKNNDLELLTTNLETTISTKISCRTEQEGEITVQAALFTNIVSLLPKGEIVLAAEEAELIVRGQGQETKLHTVPASEYPVIPEVEQEASLSFDKALLRDSLHQVLFAATINEVRPEISGILFNTSGNSLALVGTDSYRLAERKIPLKEAGETRKFIVPWRAAQELTRVLGDDGTGSVKVIISSNQVQFLADSTSLTSRLIEGNYPAYEQIIPDTYRTRVLCSTDDLLQAVRRASLFCTGGVNDISLRCQPGNGTGPGQGGSIVISATNANLGENKSVLEAIVEGNEQNIVFNYRYIIEGIQHLSQEETQIDIISESSPGVFRPSGRMAQEGQYLYLIMPIKAT